MPIERIIDIWLGLFLTAKEILWRSTLKKNTIRFHNNLWRIKFGREDDIEIKNLVFKELSGNARSNHFVQMARGILCNFECANKTQSGSG